MNSQEIRARIAYLKKRLIANEVIKIHHPEHINFYDDDSAFFQDELTRLEKEKNETNKTH